MSCQRVHDQSAIEVLFFPLFKSLLRSSITHAHRNVNKSLKLNSNSFAVKHTQIYWILCDTNEMRVIETLPLYFENF